MIQETVCYILARTCRAHRNHLEEAFRVCGLHVGQEMTLLPLWDEEGMTQSELARRVDVDLSTMSKMLYRLERAGIVERRRDTVDTRVSFVFLTDAGRALQHRVITAWEEVDQRAMRGLTDDEQATLHQLLARVEHNLH